MGRRWQPQTDQERMDAELARLKGECPHGVTLGVYCRECDYDEAMAVDTDDDD